MKKAVQNTNTVMAVVPGGCTTLVQPADVSWNAPFKAAYRKLYDTWLASGTMERTRGGNLCAPSKALRVTALQHLVCRVVQSLHTNHMQISIIEVFICRRLHMDTSMILICIWLICRLCTALHTKCCSVVGSMAIRPEIIYKSFEACGITTSDPSLIHCAKQAGAANPLYHQLQQWHQSNDTAPGDETFDTNDSGEATVLASDREDVDSDEFQEENFTDSDIDAN